MKNSAEQGGCYPQRPKAEVDNTLLRNAEFNNCFIIHSKYWLCPGVPVHRRNNYCTPLFTSLCLAYCWVYCIGSCVPVHEDRTKIFPRS